MRSSESINRRINFNSFLRLFEVLLEHLFYSVFIGDDHRARHTPLVVNLSLVIIIAYLITRDLGSWIDKLVGVLILVAYVVLEIRFVYLKSLFIISMIPTLWYGFLAFIFRPNIIASLDVMIRVFVISFSTLVFLQLINPVELSWLINKVKSGSRYSLYPNLIWRVSPHILKDLKSALMISRLKNTDISRSLAVGILVLDEYSDFYEEGLASRDEINSFYWYDIFESLKLLILFLLGFIYIIIRVVML